MSYAPAINELQIKRENLLNNIPRNEKDNPKQAKLERNIAASCKDAIEVLKESPIMKGLKKAIKK